ncbi:DUF4180 domain-containing protein [Streptomyces subrutilus]|uniref:DUF4180 domain-containing protein n=1 Tax=Streptomyces subrutilus TaxID=36818 RepID=UPI003427D528
MDETVLTPDPAAEAAALAPGEEPTEETAPVNTVRTVHGVTVLICPAEGEAIKGEREVLDFCIGDAFHHEARWVVVPVERLDEAFFRLDTRVAGEIIQKFVTYRVGVVVLGDVAHHIEGSNAFRDFVRECNRGGQTWFLADLAELHEKLAG